VEETQVRDWSKSTILWILGIMAILIGVAVYAMHTIADPDRVEALRVVSAYSLAVYLPGIWRRPPGRVRVTKKIS
jgi:hypothetical protein